MAKTKKFRVQSSWSRVLRHELLLKERGEFRVGQRPHRSVGGGCDRFTRHDEKMRVIGCWARPARSNFGRGQWID